MMRVIASISLFLLAAGVSFSQDQTLPQSLASLANSERAFARFCVEKGLRESFITFFADDGIFFQPHPVKAKETLRARPASPQTFTLNWEPIFGDISDAGDLGFTTGPYLLSDNSPQNLPPRHGCFFSVWKLQPDGSWRVVIDAGITTPGPMSSIDRVSFRAARHTLSTQKIETQTLEAERVSLMELDRELLRATSKVGIVNAFSNCLADEARLHRSGLMPLTGKESIKSYLAKKRIEVKWDPIASDIAKSADLGYTYGRYEAAVIGDASIKEVERGYYVRVWRRDVAGRWRLMFDTVSLVPPEEK